MSMPTTKILTIMSRERYWPVLSMMLLHAASPHIGRNAGASYIFVPSMCTPIRVAPRYLDPLLSTQPITHLICLICLTSVVQILSVFVLANSTVPSLNYQLLLSQPSTILFTFTHFIVTSILVSTTRVTLYNGISV